MVSHLFQDQFCTGLISLDCQLRRFEIFSQSFSKNRNGGSWWGGPFSRSILYWFSLARLPTETVRNCFPSHFLKIETVDLGGVDEKEPEIENGLGFFDLFVLFCDRSLEKKRGKR